MIHPKVKERMVNGIVTLIPGIKIFVKEEIRICMIRSFMVYPYFLIIYSSYLFHWFRKISSEVLFGNLAECSLSCQLIQCTLYSL